MQEKIINQINGRFMVYLGKAKLRKVKPGQNLYVYGKQIRTLDT